MRRTLAVLTLLVALPVLAATPLSVATPLEGAQHLSRYFAALREAAAGKKVVRALHYGDSTIAADGIARTVRARLVARFGDAGPGFVSAGMTPQFNQRSDVDSLRRGDWATRSILHGGAEGRYGLGGIVGIARTGASAVLKAPDGYSSKYTKLELWYQAGQGYGSLWAQADGAELLRTPAVAETTEDRREVRDLPQGFTTLTLGAEGGPVPLYGTVLETGAPGATWEALGIIGVGSKSFSAFGPEHLASQMAARDPDLLVLQIGGNEAGYPVLQSGSGTGYMPIYQAALDRLRGAAPQTDCLVVTPLDQGELAEDGVTVRSKPAMKRMVSAQRRVAEASGCGFWSAWDAMGGEGAIVGWVARGLAFEDLVHVAGKGQAAVAERLADALLAAYDAG